MKKFFFAFLLLAAAASPVRAQWLDPDDCWSCLDKRLHFVAGAAIDVAVRGPWITKSWRNSALKRIMLTCAVGAAYEGVQMVEAWAENNSGPGYGFSPLDLAATCSGALGMEITVAAVKALF